MKVFLYLLLLVMFGLLGMSLYFLYDSLPGPAETLVPTVPIEPTILPPSGKTKQFYTNMRFPDREITYSIESACPPEKQTEIVSALAILEDKTLLHFTSRQKGEITIICSALAPEPEIKNHFVAGEGGPTEVINTTIYAVILSGKISLFREENCATPHIAIHELLHVLGFDHNNDQTSILYPTLNCKQQIDQFLVDEINRLYAVESLAELQIISLNATKSGRYLAFNAEIVNQGLKATSNVTMAIYADARLVKEFDLGPIDIGTRKILNVENLVVGRSTEKVKFTLDPANTVAELSETNNQVELALASE